MHAVIPNKITKMSPTVCLTVYLSVLSVVLVYRVANTLQTGDTIMIMTNKYSLF